MRHFIRFMILVVLSMFLSSCHLTAWVLGVSKPSPKTEKQVLRKAHKFHFDEFPLLFTTDTGMMRYYTKDRSRTTDSASSKFYPLVFKQGYLVEPVYKEVCTSYSTSLFSSLKDSLSFQLNTNEPLTKYINSQCVINFDSTAFYADIADADFVVLIYWATYEGVFNKPKNKRLAEEIVRRNEQDSLNIKAYYINFDKRENIQLCTSTLEEFTQQPKP